MDTGLGTKLRLAPAKDTVLEVNNGDRLFSQGDPGGDLLFIEAGTIEIFITKNDQDVVLAQMGAGEVIGVMTFLTRDTRLASARAITSARIKKISSTQITRTVAAFPKWLNIVLKEFVGRIQEMNRLYSETLISLKKARETQITPLFIGTQIAASLPVISKYTKTAFGAVDGVLLADASSTLQTLLNQPKEVIESILAIFMETDLLPVIADGERKRKIIPISSIERASEFTNFVRESGKGQTRKIMRSGISDREVLQLQSLLKYVDHRKIPFDKKVDLATFDLTRDLQEVSQVAFEFDLLQRPHKIGLVVVKGEVHNGQVSFIPADLSRTLALVFSLTRLLGDGTPETTTQSDNEKKEPKEKAA